jgi:Flp pilus assembly pilin Flp
MSKVVAFLKDESGATAIEYGLISAVNAIGSSLNAKFDYITNQLK